MNFKSKVMNYLKINEEDLMNLTLPLSELTYGKPSDFKGMDEVSNIIMGSIKKHEKIYIFGDYDADGIMATSILYLTLKKLGNIPSYYIPSRSIDGYGIQLKHAQNIVKDGYNLLITVDNGVNQKEALTYLKEHGVKVIITDHHEYSEVAPHDGFIHPFEKEQKEEQCGAFVAYMLSLSLLKKEEPLLLTYAALATISDMMPLKGANRNIVRLGLKYMNEDLTHPFHLLYKGEIDEEVIGFQIAPRINAYGRMNEESNNSKIISLFIDTNYEEKEHMAHKIDMLNEQRKELLKKAEVEVIIKENLGVILIHPNLQDGLIGLLAAKYISLKHKPTMALNFKDGVYKGSIRSLEGASIVDFFPMVSPYLLTSGGHALAGALSFKEEYLEKICLAFEEFLKVHPYQEKTLQPILIENSDVTVLNYAFLRSLAPFGKDFEEPLFALNIPLSKCFVFKNHVKSYINMESSLIGFNLKDQLKRENLFLGHLKKDTYNKGKILFQANEILD